MQVSRWALANAIYFGSEAARAARWFAGISDLISVVRQGQRWFYFCGTQPVFQHAQADLPSFRMFTAQLCVQGACQPTQIIKVVESQHRNAWPRTERCRTGEESASESRQRIIIGDIDQRE